MEPLPDNHSASAAAVPPAETTRKEAFLETTSLLRDDNTKEEPEEIEQHHVVPAFLPPEETIEFEREEDIGDDQDDIILDETEHDHYANAVTQPADSDHNDHPDHGVSISSGDAPPAQLSQATPYAHEAQALIEQARRQQQESQQLEQQQHLKDEASKQEILANLQQQLEQQEQQYQAEQHHHHQQQETRNSKSPSSLAQAADYLAALHQEDDATANAATFTKDDDEDHHHHEDDELARMPAVDRIHKTASVLRAAAAFQIQRRKKQPDRSSADPTNPTPAPTTTTTTTTPAPPPPPKTTPASVPTAAMTTSPNRTASSAQGSTNLMDENLNNNNTVGVDQEQGHDHLNDMHDPESTHLTTAMVTVRTSARPPSPASKTPANNRGGARGGFVWSTRHSIAQAMAASYDEWRSLRAFFRPKKQRIWQQFLFACSTLVLPCLAIAIFLFHGLGNPPTGRCRDGPCGFNSQGQPVASASWWVLFLGCRQVITWLLARMSDVFFIDWLVLQHSFLVKLFGPAISLVFVQAKGWPSVVFWWALWDCMLLYGKGAINDHWLHWQHTFKIFTDENPSGDVPTSEWFRGTLISMFIVAFAVALKRYWMGLHLGSRLYVRFNDRLEELMKEMTLITELALWARRARDNGATYAKWLSEFDDTVGQQNRSFDTTAQSYTEATDSIKKPVNSSSVVRETMDYEKHLEQWDEPRESEEEEVSGDHIIEFRQAFAFMTRPFFFSSAFGSVESRADCIKSSDRLFRRLLLLFEEEETIDVNDLTRWMYKGCHSQGEKENAAHLVVLLNPDVENRSNILDFVKGIDKSYQRIRLLENAVDNASHVDRAYEKVINYIFFFVLGCVILAILRLDPMTMLLSLSSLIVAFSFMIGPGSASYFEGVMMILGRQPYDVGDKIAIANVDDPPNMDGSTHWMVESINLVATTARLMGTNEVATFSNGSLARCRLINMNRSPNPVVYVYTKFGTDVPYSTIALFRSALEKFVDDRPQEWQGLVGFRTSRVEAQLNFVEYMAVLQHKSPWQSLLAIKDSRAAVASFCVEIQKELGCRYIAPSLPVEISLANKNGNDEAADKSIIHQELSKSESLDLLMKAAEQFEKQSE